MKVILEDGLFLLHYFIFGNYIVTRVYENENSSC